MPHDDLHECRVFLTRPIPEPAITYLRSRCAHFSMNREDRVLERHELHERVAGAHGVLSLLTDRIDAAFFAAAGESLRVVANMAVGYDNIDIEEATRRGVMVTNTPGILTEATAEFAWALLLAAARRIPEADRFTRSGQFKAWAPMLMLGQELSGKTLGIIGAGRIGTAFALRSRGWNMRVLYSSRRDNKILDNELSAQRVDFSVVIEEADFLSLHVPLTPETHHLIDREVLQSMKSTAILVNTARGAVIDEAALVEALQRGEIAAAALDVFEEEPVIHPGLLELENVVLAPHCASATETTRTAMAMTAARNLVQALSGETPENLVNREVKTSGARC